MRVKDCMGIKEIVKAEPESKLQEIAELMKQNHIGCVPICEKDKVVGLITDRDIIIRAVAEGLDCDNVKASEIMNTNIIKTTPDTEIDDALNVMKKNQIRRLPVIEDNKIIGMLSIGDIAVYMDEEETGETISCICEECDNQKHCE